MGQTITLAEVARLVVILRSDPGSAITAALEGWDYPISREALAILDLYDLTVLANSDPKKPRPEPHTARPFKTDNREVLRRGNAGGRSRAEVVEILDRVRRGLPV